jgi:hypothetical protein
MEAIQLKAVEKAVDLLKAAGVKFYIDFCDGHVINHGDLIIQQELPPTGRKGLTAPYGFFAQFLIEAGIENVKVNEVLIIDPKEHPVQRIRGMAASYGSKHWGNGSYITTVENGKAQILRIK